MEAAAWKEPASQQEAGCSFSCVFIGWRDFSYLYICQQNEPTESKGTKTLVEEFRIAGERGQEEERLDLESDNAIRFEGRSFALKNVSSRS